MIEKSEKPSERFRCSCLPVTFLSTTNETRASATVGHDAAGHSITHCQLLFPHIGLTSRNLVTDVGSSLQYRPFVSFGKSSSHNFFLRLQTIDTKRIAPNKNNNGDTGKTEETKLPPGSSGRTEKKKKQIF